MLRSRSYALSFVLAACLALAGCGGGGASRAASADRNAKARAHLKAVLKRLQPVLTKEGRSVAGVRKALLARSARLKLVRRLDDPASGDGTVTGYDDRLGFWYTDTVAGRVEDTLYFSDQAMTTQVGYVHVDGGSAAPGVYPNTTVDNEEITVGPYKHKSMLTVTDHGPDANGSPQEDATASWTNADGTSGNYSTSYANGGSNYTRTDVDASGNSITATWIDGGINPTTVSFRNTDGTDGNLALQSDRSGTGTVQDPTSPTPTSPTQTDTMAWGSNGQGTVDYNNGTQPESMDMNPYIQSN